MINQLVDLGLQHSTTPHTLSLAHLILRQPLSLPIRVISKHLIIDANIQVPPITTIRLASEHALHRLTGLNSQNLLQVKNRLLPVRVLGVGARGEAHGLMARAELDVEPGDQGVDVVGAADGEVEGEFEGQVSGLDGVEVDGEDGSGVGDDSFELDRVDEGFGEGCGFEGGVVEAPDVVPD